MKKYCEFKNHEYYGLVTVTLDSLKKCIPNEATTKAVEKYVETVAGNSIEEVLEEDYPVEISKEEAFWKFCQDRSQHENSLEYILKEFNGVENDVLLIDEGLL